MSVSNTQLKSVNAFMDSHELIRLDGCVDLPLFPHIESCDIFVDVDSFLSRINLDCDNCLCDGCSSFYPLEVLLSVDCNFKIEDITLFVNCEDTRLISGYGKRGHLNHCVIPDLMNSPYYKGGMDVDKSVAFVESGYIPAYIGLRDRLTELFGVGFYKGLSKYLSKRKLFGPLF